MCVHHKRRLRRFSYAIPLPDLSCPLPCTFLPPVLLDASLVTISLILANVWDDNLITTNLVPAKNPFTVDEPCAASHLTCCLGWYVVV